MVARHEWRPIVKLRASAGERLFSAVNGGLMVLLIIVTLYPMLHVLFASLSDPVRLTSHVGLLWKPLGFSLAGYRLVLGNPNILIGYRNTLFYVLLGTSINLMLTTFGAFALSRRDLLLKKPLLIMIVLTMYFSGGMIPRFLVVQNLDLLNTVWALLLPNAISTWNLVIMRTSFQGMPVELEESTRIDGANEIQYLFHILIPLSMPVIAVMVLFYGVAHWNAWFDAMIFINKRPLYPLQLFLREILLQDSLSDMSETQAIQDFFNQGLVKYCTVVVSTVPILCVYPFLQKFFVKGVMVGALKG